MGSAPPRADSRQKGSELDELQDAQIKAHTCAERGLRAQAKEAETVLFTDQPFAPFCVQRSGSTDLGRAGSREACLRQEQGPCRDDEREEGV